MIDQQEMFADQTGLEAMRAEMLEDPDRATMDASIKRSKAAKSKLKMLAKILNLEPETCMAEACEAWIERIAGMVTKQ